MQKMINKITCILAVNAVWDFCCFFSIMTNTPPLSTVHTQLWKDASDRSNQAASHLMAYLVLSWGCLRLFAAVKCRLEIALLSYLFEAVVFACEAALFETMHYEQGMAVSFVSLVLACLSFHFES